MSARCLTAVTKLSLPSTQKSILRALAWRANGTFQVQVTYAEIRADTGYGYSTVRQETDMLCSLGYLSLVEATRGPGAYLVWDIVVPGRGTIPSSNPEKEVPACGTIPEKCHEMAPFPPVHAGSTPSPTQPTLSLGEEGAAATHARWLDDLYRLGWASSDPLDERQTGRIAKDFGDLDISDEVEKLVAYWQKKPRPKTWSTYLQLRNWLRRSRNGRAQITSRRPARPPDALRVSGPVKDGEPDPFDDPAGQLRRRNLR